MRHLSNVRVTAGGLVILALLIHFDRIPNASGMPIARAAQSAAQSLARDLKSEDLAVRRAAARQLAGMTDLPSDILPILRASIKDVDGVVAGQAAIALANASLPALHEIELALQDPDKEVRRRMTGALTQARQIVPEIWPLLVRAFRDADVDVQVYAAQAFGKIGESSLPLLRKTLQDADPRLRQGACDALGYVGPRAAAVSQDLLNALRDPEPSVRYQAAFALPKVDPQLEQPVPVRIEALDDSYWPIRAKACEALGLLQQRGSAAVPFLLRHVAADPDSAIRGRAAQVLGEIRVLDTQQVQQLAQGLQAKEPLVRKSVADALGSLAPEAIIAIPYFAEALNDEVGFIRLAAAEALGNFGAVALPVLVETLKSRCPTRKILFCAIARPD
jgi:HEAT repeat protein